MAGAPSLLDLWDSEWLWRRWRLGRVSTGVMDVWPTVERACMPLDDAGTREMTGEQLELGQVLGWAER